MNDTSSGFNVGFVYLLFDFCVCVRLASSKHVSKFLQPFKGRPISGYGPTSSVQRYPCLPLLFQRRGHIFVPHQRRRDSRGALLLGCKGCRWEPIPTCVGTYVELLCYWRHYRCAWTRLFSPGITPLCHVLFALYNPLSTCWYSPSHTFTTEVHSTLVLHYCMRLVYFFVWHNAVLDKMQWSFPFKLCVDVTPRYYFRNWHGLNENEQTVSRYPLKSKTEEELLSLFDAKSLDYLFSQVCI